MAWFANSAVRRLRLSWRCPRRLGQIGIVVSLAGLAIATSATPGFTNPMMAPPGAAAIATAYEQRQSDVLVSANGVVVRLLADDLDGSRHQRFIVRLPSGQTVLISHNIDLAPRLPNLQVGDAVAFRGEYEWNAQGGVVHWTHHDPNRQHPGGWLDYNGQRYQ